VLRRRPERLDAPGRRRAKQFPDLPALERDRRQCAAVERGRQGVGRAVAIDVDDAAKIDVARTDDVD
jgi:hypothetical protein